MARSEPAPPGSPAGIRSGTNREDLSAGSALNLVMFGGPTDWDGAWYSRHHLTAGLARRHRVVLIDEPTDWRSALGKPWRLLRRGMLSEHQSGVMRYTPPGWLPDIHRWSALREFLHRLRLRALRHTLRANNVAPAIFYVWRPDYQVALEGEVSAPIVYHSYDRYEHYTGAGEHARALEERLVRQAALCIAASTELGDHLGALGARDVMVLRHGVDHDVFRPATRVHPLLCDIPGPRLGFVSSFRDAVDVSALRHVAMQRPDWSLVLIGPAVFATSAKHEAFEELCRLPNVHHVGRRPRAEIPAWICGFDVALACYDVMTWAPYIQPLKMYEYLACGVPVVCSDIGAARELGDLVERAAGVGEWIPAIERALAIVDPIQRERRVAFARANSWDQRISELEGVLLRVAAVSTTT